MITGHFSNPIGLLEDIDGVRYRIIKGFRYYLTADEQGEFVDVPDGFITNFASVPRAFWSLFPPTGKYRQIAAAHDKIFLAPIIRTPMSARPCTLPEANRIFLEGCEVLGVSWLARTIMYRMLLLGSQKSWDEYRAADRKQGQGLALLTPNKLRQFEMRKVFDRMHQ